MLQTRNIPLQDVNDIRDRAEEDADDLSIDALDRGYALGVLDTLLWLNGDAGMPFGETPRRFTEADRELGTQVPGTLTTAGPVEDEDRPDLDPEDGEE